jgi:hypothetical protein
MLVIKAPSHKVFPVDATARRMKTFAAHSLGSTLSAQNLLSGTAAGS